MDIIEDNYYLSTAFNSKIEKIGAKKSAIDKYADSKNLTPLSPDKICNEVLGKSNSVWMLNNFEVGVNEFDKWRGDYELWKKMGWEQSGKIYSVIQTVKNMSMFLSIAFVLTQVLIFMLGKRGFFEDGVSITVFLIPVFIYLVLSKYLKITKNRNIIEFDRSTGIVSIPQKNDVIERVRFSEFKPYKLKQHVMHGINYYLCLRHISKDIMIINPSGSKESNGPYVDWAMLCQFMDISRPLLEIPLFEPVRYFDPVTKEYDHKSGRPERFWRDMDLDVASKLVIRSADRIRANQIQKYNDKNLDEMQWPSITEH